MDIQSWFDSNGSYSDGLKLYGSLINRNNVLFRNLAKENTANFLKLKYELKKALLSKTTVCVAASKNDNEEVVFVPKKQDEPLLLEIIKESATNSFQKETMAMYPMELHATYRQRVSDWYLACELKFKLNACADDDDATALQLIIQLENLWIRIDRAWKILDHYKDHNRIMPTEESVDYHSYSKDKLFVMRNRLETRVSKRQKTIVSMTEAVEASPEDRTLLNSLNRKVEQLHQLQIDLETIRQILKE